MLSNSVNYFNGNYFVQGISNIKRTKKCLRENETFNPEFPDSIDIKITNKCNWGCSYCHESSCSNGKEFNLENTKKILSNLPPVGIELAIGGGNIMSNPDKSLEFIRWANNYGFSTRITLSYRDIIQIDNEFDTSINTNSKFQIIQEVGAIGISVDKYFKDIASSSLFMFKPKVFHVIIGIISIDDLYKYITSSNLLTKNNILILGFKQFGRAKNMKVNKLDEWKTEIRKIIYKIRCGFFKGTKISFDNLALEQLDLKNTLTEKEWCSLYYGEEFSCSMYIDAVEETFAPTSRDPNRTSWKDIDILTYFNTYKNEF